MNIIATILAAAIILTILFITINKKAIDSNSAFLVWAAVALYAIPFFSEITLGPGGVELKKNIEDFRKSIKNLDAVVEVQDKFTFSRIRGFPDLLAGGPQDKIDLKENAQKIIAWLGNDSTKRMLLQQWMKANDLDISITAFIYADSFENDREKAIKELGIQNMLNEKNKIEN
ncbi:hypothetical protein HYV49_04245 [Candidatus Pacearchaeota archaeon]|nr:hypothetical protein [Candidatus Pacearchaeota archaeon]